MDDISSLNRHNFVTGAKKMYTSSSPYDKFLTNYEKNILPDLEKASKEHVDAEANRDMDDSGNVDREYYLAICRALDSARTGKNYTETMRLLITNLQHDKNMVYDNLPTPAEAKIIFMEMWSKQFPETKDMNERKLQEFIRTEFSKVSVFPEETMIKSLNPNNMNEKSILQNLKDVIWGYALQCKNRIINDRKESDIKVLYAMILLEERLIRKVYRSENDGKISDLEEKLFENTEWITKIEEKENVNEELFSYFSLAEKNWALKEKTKEFLNHIFDDIPYKIEDSDMESLKLMNNPDELTILNKDINSDFHRFYLKLNFEDYKKIAKKIQWNALSWWMNIWIAINGIETSFIIAPSNPEFLIHELSHSIDPWRWKRQGKDKIIDECIWFYTSVIYPAVYTSTNPDTKQTTKRIVEKELWYIKYALLEEHYWKQVFPNKEISYEEYKINVEELIKKLQEIEDKIWKKELFKLMLNSLTIDEIERYPIFLNINKRK